MPDCPDCGTHLARRHRRPLERILYSNRFFCPECGRRWAQRRVPLWFIFARHTRCIQCGTPQVERASKPDRIDAFSRRLFSRLMHLGGAPLYKCRACRLQYYDWRTPEPAPPQGPAGIAPPAARSSRPDRVPDTLPS